MILVTALFAGYLLGSLSPAYFLTRLLTGRDIRTMGDGNAGTTNVFRNVGVLPGIITAVIDLAKGIMAVYLSHNLLGASLVTAYLSGFAAIGGHILPFYLRFRGGQGAATAAGMLLYSLYRLAAAHPDPRFLGRDLLLLGLIALLVLAVTRTREYLALTVLPALCYLMLLRFAPAAELYAALLLSFFLLLVGAYNLLRLGKLPWCLADAAAAGAAAGANPNKNKAPGGENSGGADENDGYSIIKYL